MIPLLGSTWSSQICRQVVDEWLPGAERVGKWGENADGEAISF